MSWAKIRKVDHIFLELNSSKMDFDTADFIEVETDESFNSTDRYYFNLATASFYNVGAKPEIVNPVKTETIASPFASADNFRFRGEGFNGIGAKSPDGSANESIIDWEILEDRFINGTHVMLSGQEFGDTYTIEIVDKTYAFAGILYPAKYDATGDGSVMMDWADVLPNGVVLDTFIKNWHVVSDMEGQKPILLPYPAKLYAKMTIRLKYKAYGQVSDVKISLNGFMHKKTEV